MQTRTISRQPMAWYLFPLSLPMDALMRFHTAHPCMCDDCLKARDDELRRTRESERARVVTIIDGCVVHGDKPMSEESKAAISEVIAAVKAKLAS